MGLNDPYVNDNEVSGPINNWYPITPHDSNDLPIRPRAIYAAGAGSIVAIDSGGREGTFIMAAGEIKPLRPFKIKAAGTTATGLMGLY